MPSLRVIYLSLPILSGGRLRKELQPSVRPRGQGLYWALCHFLLSLEKGSGAHLFLASPSSSLELNRPASSPLVDCSQGKEVCLYPAPVDTEHSVLNYFQPAGPGNLYLLFLISSSCTLETLDPENNPSHRVLQAVCGSASPKLFFSTHFLFPSPFFLLSYFSSNLYPGWSILLGSVGEQHGGRVASNV